MNQTEMLQQLMAEIAELKLQQQAQSKIISRNSRKGVKAAPIPSRLEVQEKLMNKLLDEEQQEQVDELNAEIKQLKDQYKLQNSKLYQHQIGELNKGVIKYMIKKKEKQLRKMYRNSKINQYQKVVVNKKVQAVEQDEMKLLRELMTKYMSRM